MAAHASPERAQRIAQLRMQVLTGSYMVTPDQIAASIMSRADMDTRLGRRVPRGRRTR
jgi:anti-sigma28 factor (negative regulator of flagellin synthesis)